MSEQAKKEPPTSAKPQNPVDLATDKSPQEFGGPQGLEPTRYGDWERNGRCVDF